MSYQVLARKWRPRNFQEVVGQQHVLTALANGLAQNKVHHAYLFSGTRGVGKTSIARILAKCLNCEQGVTATPCGKCVNCQAIDEGRFVDLLEIDAASRTKVDDTRELLDNVQYKPAQGRYKVYLIDEVHMLSKHSFNALLKTLEEPPEYVKFVLATTDPKKLPITVLSRCLQFHLKAISAQEIEKQLTYILQQEKASFESAALAVIAKAADGSIRDALSLTDQALAFGAGNIEYQSVLKMLGTIDNSHLYYLLHFIASGDVDKVFQKIEEFVQLGADFAKLHQELARLCHHIALQQIRNKGSISEKTAIQLLAERLSPEEVQLYYQIATQGYKDYAFAPNGKIAFEMMVMRLLAFKPANYIALDERLLAPAQPIIETVSATCAEAKSVASILATSQAASDVASDPVSLVPENVNTVLPESVISHANSSPASVNNQNTTTIPQAPVMPEPHVAIENASVAMDSQTETLISREALPAQKNVQQNVSTDTLSADVAPESAEQITHSRNMLRSHRLKREKEKKPLATTANEFIHPVVAEKTVSVKVESETYVKVPEQSHINALDPPWSVTNASELQSLPPVELLPPIESYLQDDCSESQESAVQPPTVMPEPHLHKTPVPSSTERTTEVDPSFFSEQQLEIPTFNVAKYVEDKLTDPWSLVIQQMQLVGLVKILAKNCVMKQNQQQIVLTLKSEQQHLLNNSQICEQLQQKLKIHYGEQTQMYIEVGNVDGQLTPIESELEIFQQYLNNAKKNIKDDKNIQTWVREYGAKIYENSIIPL